MFLSVLSPPFHLCNLDKQLSLVDKLVIWPDSEETLSCKLNV